MSSVCAFLLISCLVGCSKHSGKADSGKAGGRAESDRGGAADAAQTKLDSQTARPTETGGPRTDPAGAPDPEPAGPGAITMVDSAVAIPTASAVQQQTQDRDLLDPEKDGWGSEAFAEQAKNQLEKLCDLIVSDEPAGSNSLDQIVAPSFVGSRLRPPNRTTAYQDNATDVHWADDPPRDSVRGVAELQQAIKDLTIFLGGGSGDAHVKVIRVSLENETATTQAYFDALSTTQEESVQIGSIWHCRWQRPPDAPPRLTALWITNYEEVVARGPQGKWFADCTQAVIGDTPEFRSQLSYGHHYWLQRIERAHRFDTSVRNGLAIGDANGDGLDDVYVCQPPGLPNLLLIRQADGTARNRAHQAGVDWMDQTCSVLFLDLDNDADQDLVLGTTAGVLVMSNDGKGKFELKATLPADYDVQSLAAADYDRDGDVDLFVCVYRTASQQNVVPFLYRDGRGGGKNLLYRNDIASGEWEFTDVTDECGLGDGADRYSLAASWEDFDNDGDQDLYVANDFGRNCLYENRDGKFVDVAEITGVLDIGSGMSVSWGDFNRDGNMDLYVGNMFSSAGQRVTTNEQFRPQEDLTVRDIYLRLAKGNSLFANAGDGTFDEVGAQAQVELGRWAWSSLFTDLNNDGWEDLLVANGYFTTDDTGDL